MNKVKPIIVNIDKLTVFLFLNRKMINDLKSDLPEYLVAAENASNRVDSFIGIVHHCHLQVSMFSQL